MKNLQANLTEIRAIKSQYEQEIQQFINQKLQEFHQEVNLLVQYIDIDIENDHEDEQHLTQVSEFKLNINIEL